MQKWLISRTIDGYSGVALHKGQFTKVSTSSSGSSWENVERSWNEMFWKGPVREPALISEFELGTNIDKGL